MIIIEIKDRQKVLIALYHLTHINEVPFMY